MNGNTSTIQLNCTPFRANSERVNCTPVNCIEAPANFSLFDAVRIEKADPAQTFVPVTNGPPRNGSGNWPLFPAGDPPADGAVESAALCADSVPAAVPTRVARAAQSTTAAGRTGKAGEKMVVVPLRSSQKEDVGMWFYNSAQSGGVTAKVHSDNGFRDCGAVRCPVSRIAVCESS